MAAISWFEQLGIEDVDSVGGKGANLGELTSAGLPVPPGFVVTAQAYLAAVESAGIRDKLVAIQSDCDADDEAALTVSSDLARGLLRSTPIPAQLHDEILSAYHQLSAEAGADGAVSVAVRSSGTSEDSGDTSFAGMNETFTNVTGDKDVLERIVDCWASLYGRRVMAYRAASSLTEEPTIAVIVQRMIPSERSGIVFTADPTTGASDHLVVEAIVGQGEA